MGIVHRDVKPGNLLVSDGKAGGGPASGAEVVKLADFGIARALGQSSITQVGSVLGTAAYLAPEQARGEEAGPRADIYSLGVVAYQLLSGRLPYEASSLSELALKQQREAPLALEDLDPQIPRPLARAVGAALALDQEDRPADTIVFAEALRRGAQGVEASGAMPVAAEGTRATRVLRGEDAPLHGDAPPAGRERDAPTAATRAARPAARGTRTADPATVARPARRLEPRPYAGAAGPAADHVPEQRRSGKAGRRFAIALAVLLLFVAAVAAAVAISTNTSKTAVQIRNVIAHDTQSAINQVQNLIGQNTK
jgi:serine/threonine-protein kinase